jgi:phosphate transport system substrate-binding protein
MRTAILQKAVVAVGTIIALAACGGVSSSSSSPSPTAQADVGSGQLQGDGSSFAVPFFTKAFYEYNQMHNQVSVNYGGHGSGAGISAFTAKTVDFGATDVPMSPTEIAAAGGDSTLVQVPVLLGVVAIAYNLQGVDGLRLDGPTLAKIYMGQITKWDDPAIKSLNPKASLPATNVTVVHRSDGSGTTYTFTDYLAKISPDWKAKVGVAKSVQWPVGVGGAQNAGVGQQVKTTDGAIGYVELAYVIQSQLQQAYLKNAAGQFVQASEAGATAAASQATNISPTNFSITNQPGAKSAPISTFTWVVLRTEQTDEQKAKANVYLWKWFVTDGQSLGKDLQYAPIPKEVQSTATDTLKKVTVNGKAVLNS